MQPPFIYLDHAATTAVSATVREAMHATLEAAFGNPSSSHPLGSRARELVEEARGRVARATGADREQVIFTSGGTEANNLAVLGLARAVPSLRARNGEAEVLFGPTEHPSVRAAAGALESEGLAVESMRLDANGRLDVLHAASRIGPGTRVVAQMLVNNEFGTRYDIERLARACTARGCAQTHLHIDAVQALGKLPLDVTALFESLNLSGSLALSAHKIHGPKGCGALVLSRNARPPQPLVFGGGQERDLRPGTENTPGIVGFGAAIKDATNDLKAAFQNLERARRAFEVAIAKALPSARVLVPYTDGEHASPHVLSLAVPGAPAEVWLHHLEVHNVFASAGSACQAHGSEISPALLAMGLDADSARHVLRFSFAPETTNEECALAAAALAAVATEIAHL